jgi:hypothetical protein
MLAEMRAYWRRETEITYLEAQARQRAQKQKEKPEPGREEAQQ